MANEVAERYSQGLFELARETGTVEDKKEQAEALIKVLTQEPDFKVFLRAVKITKEEKRNLIDTVFQEYLDPHMRSFLKLLIDKGRSYYMEDILRAYVVLANRELGIQHAVVESARPLAEEDLEKIRKTLEKRTGNKIRIENRIVPELIAGIKVITENQVTDVTMKSKIDGMKKALLKGGRA